MSFCCPWYIILFFLPITLFSYAQRFGLLCCWNVPIMRIKSHLLCFSDFLKIQKINVQIGLIVFTRYWKRNVAISEPPSFPLFPRRNVCVKPGYEARAWSPDHFYLQPHMRRFACSMPSTHCVVPSRYNILLPYLHQLYCRQFGVAGQDVRSHLLEGRGRREGVPQDTP